MALAKKRLIEWLAAGKLPWSCMDWKAGKYHPGSVFAAQLASIASGDPRFWSDLPIKIDWEDNCAREDFRHGAEALGITVSLQRLLALLPEEPRGPEDALRQTKPAERKLTEPKAWLAKVRKEHPRKQRERMSDYVDRLHTLMQEADVTDIWPISTLRRRLYD